MLRLAQLRVINNTSLGELKFYYQSQALKNINESCNGVRLSQNTGHRSFFFALTRYQVLFTEEGATFTCSFHSEQHSPLVSPKSTQAFSGDVHTCTHKHMLSQTGCSMHKHAWGMCTHANTQHRSHTQRHTRTADAIREQWPWDAAL